MEKTAQEAVVAAANAKLIEAVKQAVKAKEISACLAHMLYPKNDANLPLAFYAIGVLPGRCQSEGR